METFSAALQNLDKAGSRDKGQWARAPYFGVAQGSGLCEGCLWDAVRLPLRSECVDALVSDLPFAVRVNPGKNQCVLFCSAARCLLGS